MSYVCYKERPVEVTKPNTNTKLMYVLVSDLLFNTYLGLKIRAKWWENLLP